MASKEVEVICPNGERFLVTVEWGIPANEDRTTLRPEDHRITEVYWKGGDILAQIFEHHVWKNQVLACFYYQSMFELIFIVEQAYGQKDGRLYFDGFQVNAYLPQGKGGIPASLKATA